MLNHCHGHSFQPCAPKGTPPRSRTYFTDGSVDPTTHTARYGIAVRDNTISISRVIDNASLLQVEAIAIMEVLAHVSQREEHAIIQIPVQPLTAHPKISTS